MAEGRSTRVRRRYHFHFPGILYVAVTMFLAVGAVNSQNNLLFFALGLAIGGLLVSGVLSGASLIGIRVERLPIPTGRVGEPLTVRYRIANSNAVFPAFGLHIEEAGASRKPAFWRRFLPHMGTFAPHVPARGVRHVKASAVPHRRGTVAFNDLRVWSTFPFGLAKKSTTYSLPQSALVHPPVLPLRPGVIAQITAKSPYGLGGQRSRGMGDDFFGLREYAPGDPPRNIAWRPSARTGNLLVREFSSPAPSRLWVVLAVQGDAARTDEFEANLELAIALASSILAHAHADGTAVGLSVPTLGLVHPPHLNRWHLQRIMGDLALLDFSAGLPGEPTFPESAARSGACVVIHAGDISDGLGPRHARHLSAVDIDRHVEATPHTRAILAHLRTPSDSQKRPRRHTAQAAAVPA